MRDRSESGFTLVELMVASSISLMALTMLYSTLIGYRKLAIDHGLRTDTVSTLRTALDFMARDIDRAGYHLINNGSLAQFGVVFPNVDASDLFTQDSLTIWSHSDIAEGTLLSTMAATSSALTVGDVDGFAVGQRVYVIGLCSDDVVRRDSFVVTALDTTSPFRLYHAMPTNPSASLTCRFKSGARVARLSRVVYSLSAPVGGVMDLLRTQDETAATIIATGISSLRFRYFDGSDPAAEVMPDLASERRDLRRVRIELEAKAAQKMRGSGLKSKVAVSEDVAPRNLVLEDAS